MNDEMVQSDVEPRAFMNGHAFSHVRRVTVDDIEWGLSLGEMHYPGSFDKNGVRAWAHARLHEPSMVFLRSDHVLGVAHLGERYHAPGHQQAYLTLLYAEPGNYGREVVRVMQGLRDWATEKGAYKFWFGDVTGHDMNKLATVLGGRLAGHTYVMDLDGDSASLG